MTAVPDHVQSTAFVFLLCSSVDASFLFGAVFG